MFYAHVSVLIITLQIEFYKNAVTDDSKKFDDITRRGSLRNVAVKLYGTSHPTAHPKLPHPNGNEMDDIMNPWWETNKQKRSFMIVKYDAVDGGINPKDGKDTKNSVDLALLTLSGKAVLSYFMPLKIDITKQLQRLKWPTKDELLKGIDHFLEHIFYLIFN